MYLFVLDRRYISVRGVFLFKTLLMEDITSKGSFPFLRRLFYDAYQALVALRAPDKEFESES